MPDHHEHAESAVQGAGAVADQAVVAQTGPADLAVGEPGLWTGHHPEAGRVRTPTELDPVAEHRQGGVEPAQPAPDLGPDQHPAGRDPEPLLGRVSLPLVDLVGIDHQLAAAGPGDRDPDLGNRLTGPATSRQQQLRPGHVDARLGGHLGQQPDQRVRSRYGVVVQQPQPAVRFGCGLCALAGLTARLVVPRAWRRAQLVFVRLVSRACRRAHRHITGGRVGPILLERGGDSPAETPPALPLVQRVEDLLLQRPPQQPAGGVAAPVVDREDPGRPVRQRGQSGQCLGQPAFGVEGDQHRGDPVSPDVDQPGLVVLGTDPGPGIGLHLRRRADRPQRLGPFVRALVEVAADPDLGRPIVPRSLVRGAGAGPLSTPGSERDGVGDFVDHGCAAQPLRCRGVRGRTGGRAHLRAAAPLGPRQSSAGSPTARSTDVPVPTGPRPARS